MQTKVDRRKKYYKSLAKSDELAELIGIILGDGHLQQFPRTERLVITCGASKIKYIKRIVEMVTRVFDKTPRLLKRKGEDTFDISLYQCELTRRLGIPPGNKIKNNVAVPAWIKNKKRYMIRCLKGLLETDGCFQEDSVNYAQFIELRNLCHQIRLDTYYMFVRLGYHPQLGATYVRLARKAEVYPFKRLISFRDN